MTIEREALPTGLSTAQAQQRLRDEGYNELAHQGRRSIARIFLGVLREPMLAMLLGAGLIYLALGDQQEALILLGFAGFSVLVTLVQETRTERALAALRDLTSPRAMVIRDGVRSLVAGRDIVRDDLVVLNEGSRVAADGWVVSRGGECAVMLEQVKGWS